MRHGDTTMTTCCAALVMALTLLTPGEANSASVEHDTHLTFEYPVRIAGTTLPAGSYVFQLDEGKQAVWIFNEEGGKVFGPYLTRPRSRTTATRERVVIFDRPRDAGGVPAVRAWFGRNNLRGREFVHTADDRG